MGGDTNENITLTFWSAPAHTPGTIPFYVSNGALFSPLYDDDAYDVEYPDDKDDYKAYYVDKTMSGSLNHKYNFTFWAYYMHKPGTSKYCVGCGGFDGRCIIENSHDCTKELPFGFGKQRIKHKFNFYAFDKRKFAYSALVR